MWRHCLCKTGLVAGSAESFSAGASPLFAAEALLFGTPLAARNALLAEERFAAEYKRRHASVTGGVNCAFIALLLGVVVVH